MRGAPPTGCRRAGSRSISRRRAITSCRRGRRDRVAQTLRLAERLGATAVTLPGRDIADDLLDYARANNITQIIIGKSRRTRWFELLHGSVVDALVRRSGNIGIQVLAAETVESELGSRLGSAQRPPFSPEPYFIATTLVVLATAIGYTFDRQIDLPNISMIFIPVVLFSAIRHGLLPSLWATLLSTLAYNFFFLEPLYTLTIEDPQNIVALFFLLLVAVIASQLAAQSRAQAQAARRQAASTAALYGFSRKIAGIGNMDDLLWAIAHQIALMLKAHVVLLLPEGGDLKVRVGYPPEDELDEADLAAAKWSWSRGQPAGRSSDTLPGAKRLFLPLRTERGLVGVMGLDRPESGGHAAVAGRAATAGRAGRPGRGRDRAHHARRRHRRGAGDRRDRAFAIGAADLDLARPEDAARLHHRLHHQLAEILADVRRADARRAAEHRAGRGRAPDPLRRQRARHDAAGSQERRRRSCSPPMSRRCWASSPAMCAARCRICASRSRRRPACRPP